MEQRNHFFPKQENRKRDLILAVQAGGQSRRMGQDKSLLPFLGQPLIQRVVERGRDLTGEILIIANDPTKYRFLGLPVQPDLMPGHGPLSGLHAALKTARVPYVALVACDMPFISAAALRFELEMLVEGGYDAVIPQSDKGLEPLHAVYRREACLEPVERALEAGLYALTGWLAGARVLALPAERLAPFDPRGLAFANVNSPEDVARAEEIARSEHSNYP